MLRTRLCSFTLLILGLTYGRRIIKPLPNCDCGLTHSHVTHISKREAFKPPEIQAIIGGIEAEINEFPWTVGLHTHYKCFGPPVCGGTLISTQHIVTAAHCVEGITFKVGQKHPKKAFLYLGGLIQCASLGDHDVTSNSETTSTKRRLLNTE